MEPQGQNNNTLWSLGGRNNSIVPVLCSLHRLSLATASRRTMASEASSVAKIPKPEMRGFLISYIKKNMIASFVFSSVLAGAYW